MNNPFLRFKHYHFDSKNGTDPKENHATECLAAALIFSEAVKLQFIKFLFMEEIPSDVLEVVSDGSAIDVVTQESLGKHGFADLLISSPGQFNIIVEVKVYAKEDSRHQKQLEDYQSWLMAQKKPWFLFTLVKNPDSGFAFKECGVSQRHTWATLYADLKRFVGQDSKLGSGKPYTSLVFNLCDYLEKEGIVINWKTADLLLYENGMKAQKAFQGIFDQVKERLQEQGYETKIKWGDHAAWPRFEVGKAAWKDIFGEGYLNKLYIWLQVPPIWGSKEEGFVFDIRLWDKLHNNSWDLAKQRLPAWFAEFKRRGLPTRVGESWKSEERKLSSLTDIKVENRPVWFRSGLLLEPIS